jgi:diaminopimelate epimerase
LKEFVKYQSLGNDFILFDWTTHAETVINERINHSHWKSHVVSLCDRHTGVGADGILLLKLRLDSTFEMLIFNSDGSRAEICLNGIRCSAHYLYHRDKQCRTFHIQAGSQSIRNQILLSDKEHGYLRILTQVSSPVFEKSISVSTGEGIFNGHQVHVGNPHFVVFQKKELSWLSQHGVLIEQHSYFPQKTNVEFVWKDHEEDSSTYRVLVYERGCGITLSCSSGAVAIMKALHQLGMVRHEESINLVMLGGILECTISQQGRVSLIGNAHRVFSGRLA